MEATQLLEAALKALNQIPNTKLNDKQYKNTYDLASAIHRHLKEKKEATSGN